MKAHIVDQAALAARTPSDVVAYLRGTGWQRTYAGRYGPLWTKQVDGDEFEVLAPEDSALRDYPARVRDVLGVLAVVEGRSELEILRDLSHVTSDAQYIRTTPDGSPGTTPIDDGVRAYESARNLVLAAAYSVAADQPRAVQPGRKPADVARFMREVRIGPSLEGSYVLSILTPVPPQLSLEQGDPFEPEFRSAQPFERQVSLRLFEAVNAARDAAARVLFDFSGLDEFTANVPRGVSANLCEALVGLGGESGRPFDVSFGWALARPVASLPRTVCFSSELLPVLGEAARELREKTGEEGVQIVGNVVRLHRESDVGIGEVSVAGTVDGDDGDRLRRVWMELGPADYPKAVDAHRRLQPIAVTGDLVRRGNRSYLRNPRNLQILD